MDYKSEAFRDIVDRAVNYHGHLCMGLYIGIRMGICAREQLDLDPAADYFAVHMETDRCPADGIVSALGLSLGHRKVKLLDHGKCAASFYDMHTGDGARLVFKGLEKPDKKSDLIDYFSQTADEDFFKIEPVHRDFSKADLPGPLEHEVACCVCGEMIQDHHEITVDGSCYCKPCFKSLLPGLF